MNRFSRDLLEYHRRRRREERWQAAITWTQSLLFYGFMLLLALGVIKLIEIFTGAPVGAYPQ